MAYYVVVLYKENLYNMEVEFPGSISIGSGKKDDIIIEGLDNSHITVKFNKKGQLSISSKAPYNFSNSDCDVNKLIVIDSDNHLAVYVSDEINIIEQPLKIPYQCVIRVGRSDKNNIVIKSPFVSGSHFTLKSESGVIHVEDNGSTNGLYLNGKRISKARLRAGDVLSILHYNFKVGNCELLFENLGGIIRVQGIEEEKALGGVAKTVESEEGMLHYRRSPRTQEQLPTEDIVLANAPTAGGKFEKRRGMGVSLFSSGAMTAVSLATSAISPALLAARTASLISPVASVLRSSGDDKRRKGKAAEYENMRIVKYTQYINEQKARIEEVARVQRKIINRENPSPAECVSKLNCLERTLWERSVYDRDFLDVRLGMGYENLCVNVKGRDDNGFQMEIDDVQELSKIIIEETRIVDNVPARLKMNQYSTIGFSGTRSKVIDLVKNMIVTLTYSHCHEEVKIVGFFDENERERWEALRWFPHVWDENMQCRFLAFDEDRAKSICEIFNEVLKTRVSNDNEYSRNKTKSIPHYIFIMGSRTLTEKQEVMSILTSNNPSISATTLFLYNDLYSLPHNCQFIVDVDDPIGANGYLRTEVNNKFIFTLDTKVTDNEFDSYARRMSSIELEGFATKADIPQGVTFLEGYGVQRIEELEILERWKHSHPEKSLAAPIGVMSGGKTFSLDIHEKAHGAHGLVAGTTGSGKSETLQSWIISMCVNYHPHDVNFVIIDYKGGGMANLMERFPHVVGKITNISCNISRSLISLQSENHRRERMMSQFDGCNHIDKYQELYRQGIATEPMPHLVIVSDEFAELKQNEPEFMAGLNSVARVGRSLGVHLVLATQKPSGVVDDQVKANSRFSLCLKVQSAGDSREMLGKPDAAKITQIGRCYVRVGQDEIYELFQSYWSGAEYNPDASAKDKGNQVRIVSLDGTRKKTESSSGNVVKKLDELTAIREYLCDLCEKNNIKKLDGPWLAELPERLCFNDMKIQGAFDGYGWNTNLPWLSIPVGMYDDPINQKQGIQYINLVEGGHLGIYGAPSTGKTTMLKNIAYSLCQCYSPKDVNLYIMDCGGWGMNVFSNMPHVGGVALDCEEEKFQKLAGMLVQEMNRRKKIFLSYGVGSLEGYRQTNQGDMPAIVVMIDNIVPIFDLYGDLMEPVLAMLSREGSTYGIYLIYTANTTTGVRYKLVQNIRNAVAFELTDKGDYSSIVGRLDGMKLSQVAGRAFVKNVPPLEVQMALPLDASSDHEQSAVIQNVSNAMDEVWDGARPEAIPVMPEQLTFDELFRHYHTREEIPVGFSYASIKPTIIDMFENYSMLISGTMRCGKSRYLMGIAKQIHLHRENDKIYVIDSKEGSLKTAEEYATKYAKVDDDDKVNEMMAELVEELNVRARARNQAKSIDGGAFSEHDFIEEYDQIVILIDDMKEMVDEMSSESHDSLDRICRHAQGLGVLVFAAGRVPDLVRLSDLEKVSRAIISGQRGVGLGTNVSMHSYLKNDMSYKEKEVDPGEGNGFAFISGHADKIKLPQ